jgi:[protein-PII] uridylyltransferase
MRRYFLVARDVGALTRAMSATLEARQQKKTLSLSRLMPGRKRNLGVPGFIEEGRRLSVTGPEVFAEDPVKLLKLFVIADQHDLDLHPHAFSAVTRSLGLVTTRLRRNPEATAAFLHILAHGSRPYRVLTIMNETGLLGRFLPEWGRIVGQTQFNMYHAYTVDEHTLQAIGIINDIARGKLQHDHPNSSSIIHLIADPEVLMLAMLLHDWASILAGSSWWSGWFETTWRSATTPRSATPPTRRPSGPSPNWSETRSGCGCSWC